MDWMLKLAAVLITLSIMLTIIASTVIVTAFLARVY